MRYATSFAALGEARPSARRPVSVVCRSTVPTAILSASSCRHITTSEPINGEEVQENRRRFVMAVYAEIRKQVGADFPVGIKLNSADFQRGGFTEEESIATIQALADAGIDLIEISGGTYEAPAMSGAFQQPQKATTAAREAYFLEFAEKVRAAVRVPLMVTGGFPHCRRHERSIAIRRT
jgi:2,4-dienoyl-CoA reductase-like NADH-dependent reductase (Old Yellow Enzyme family)